MKNKAVNKKEILTKVIMSASLLALLFLSFLFSETFEKLLGLNVKFAKNEVTFEEISSLGYNVHFLDVGQGSCTVVELSDGKTLLVDGGNTMYGETVGNFLKSQNISQIDYLIATHSDSDHIGGLNYILENFEVKQIFRPFQISGVGSSSAMFVPSESEDLGGVYEFLAEKYGTKNKISRVTSNVYSQFISNVYAETFTDNGASVQSSVTVFYDGLKIVGENYSFEFFAPLLHSENLNIAEISNRTTGYATMGYGVTSSNDCSAMFLLTCGLEKYFFSGDASFNETNQNFSKSAEHDFINSLTDSEKSKISGVSAYLAGHHGSAFSSSSELLELLKPKFVVFSVGVGNSYGHPSEEVIERLEKIDSLEQDGILRTDKFSNITISGTNSRVVYALEVTAHDQKFVISWQLFASVICGIVIMIIVFIKPKTHSGTQFHWHKKEISLL